MSEPFLGEIKMFAGNFAPRGYAFCNGQLLAVSQFDALFSLLGTIYGGDGRTTFALPDLRGRTPIHVGSGPGLTLRNIGTRGGQERVTLATNNLPAHNHGSITAVNDAANSTSPAGNTLANSTTPVYVPGSPQAMDPAAVTTTGSGQSHPNMMPFHAIHYIIALQGVFPSRS